MGRRFESCRAHHPSLLDAAQVPSYRARVHPPIHLALSWLVGHRLRHRRDRVLVTWAGVVPDVDAISRLWGIGAYSRYHHVLAHGLVAAVLVALACWAAAKERWKVLVLALATFHLHLICDLLGSGVDKEPWSITYLWPWSDKEIYVTFGWDLSSPQNGLIWLAAVALTVWIGIKQGHTFAETFMTAHADAKIVEVLRKVFVKPKAGATGVA
jgi:LexA-binding, inner membrane-associated putative hydrolase